MRWWWPVVVCCATALAVSPGCDDSDADADAGRDSDVDSAVDAGTDAGTDAGADADTDAGRHVCEGGRYDPRTGLCWQDPWAGEPYGWQAAIDYCEALDLAGHTDWVHPSRQDLVELLEACDADVLAGDFGSCNTCAASATCSALFGSDTHRYWSSSRVVVQKNFSWWVDFDSGQVSGAVNNGDADNDVRCVRAGP